MSLFFTNLVALLRLKLAEFVVMWILKKLGAYGQKICKVLVNISIDLCINQGIHKCAMHKYF